MYTEEELQMFEEQLRERMRNNAFDGHAQPGEVHVRHTVSHSVLLRRVRARPFEGCVLVRMRL